MRTCSSIVTVLRASYSAEKPHSQPIDLNALCQTVDKRLCCARVTPRVCILRRNSSYCRADIAAGSKHDFTILSPIPHLLPNCSMYPFQESIALPDDSVSASVCYVPVSLVSSEMIKDSLNHAPPALDAHRIDICPER